MTFILLTTIVLGCNTNMKDENAELKAELAVLAEENAMLAAGDIVMELKVEEYQAMLLEIDQNLASIDEKHNTVKELTAGSAEDVEEDILLHIEHVHGTLANTKHKITHLQNNLDELYKDETADKEIIATLENELDQATVAVLARDEVIDALNEEVIGEGIVIDHLSVAYEEQTVVSEILYGILNTAYIVVGTKKELEEYGIIEKGGGIKGMGSVKSLAATADDEWFILIPIDATDNIELYCKKAKLLTLQPESSYEFLGEKDIEGLAILDKAAFWDKTDFLVIEIVEEK